MLNPKADALRLLAELPADLDKLVQAHNACVQAAEGMAAGTRQLQQMDARLNLRYLQLQETIQREHRQVATLSNAMKTKHDTAKNVINNIG